MQQLTVELGPRSYPITVGPGLLTQLADHLPASTGKQLAIVTTETVAHHYLPTLQQALADWQLVVIELPDGEGTKSVANWQLILDRLFEARFNRDCTVLALGGGVIGDLAGFAAACFQRGVKLIQVPTTLLAQVDSSVGGKTAVNHPAGKNLIGAFHQPESVIIDTDVLQTLPEREFLAGLAEVIKYGIMADATFFAWLEANLAQLLARESIALTHAITSSCQIKAQVVAGDEREQGQRAFLNLGHTFGHAIEGATGYGAWLHGEAVATGMHIAARLAVLTSDLSEAEAERIRALLQAAGLPTEPPALAWEQWLSWMQQDKKVQAGQLRFIIPQGLGAARFLNNPEPQLVQRAIGLG